MNAAGNDFVIIDARRNTDQIGLNFSEKQIAKICARKNIGCDQLIILRESADSAADCVMEIYNSDGSRSGACGNVTRCVAALMMVEKNADEAKIETAVGVLKCWKEGDLIAVDMGAPKFAAAEIPLRNVAQNPQKISLFGFDFSCVNMGNPHAICFISQSLDDKTFFEIGTKVENHETFPDRTNVEFARILADDLIEVRVWERGAGETLACGSGACAVAVAAIKSVRVQAKKITTRFKGGDLVIEWNGDENSTVTMVGGYQKIFSGVIDAEFLC